MAAPEEKYANYISVIVTSSHVGPCGLVAENLFLSPWKTSIQHWEGVREGGCHLDLFLMEDLLVGVFAGKGVVAVGCLVIGLQIGSLGTSGTSSICSLCILKSM